ncbi:hypothetical protein AAMO2058_000595300 [Amorphochlora amoebiformis]
MHIAPSKRRSPAPPGPPSPNRHRDAQMMNKRVLQAAHHVANAAVIAFAAPISITRQSRRVAYTARALWATWSGVSVRDFHVDRRESIMGLAESRDKRMAAARQLDRALVGASLKSEISNVEVMALYWENREKLRLEGAGGGRRALMRCRMDREFDDRFVQTLNARIEAYYSPRAILTKSLLSFATLGMIPHMMRMLWFNADNKLDRFLFGKVQAIPTCSEAEAAVFEGIEMISWYNGVVPGDCGDMNGMDREINPLMVFDRVGKRPLFPF